MSDAALKDLSDLTSEEREALSRVVEAIRRARTHGKDEEPFARFWDKFKKSRSPMAENDAEAVAREAVHFARGTA